MKNAKQKKICNEDPAKQSKDYHLVALSTHFCIFIFYSTILPSHLNHSNSKYVNRSLFCSGAIGQSWRGRER